MTSTLVALGMLVALAVHESGVAWAQVVRGHRATAATRATARDSRTTQVFRLLGRTAKWSHVRTLALEWDTFHTQGLAKIGDLFYVSAVEVLERTASNGAATDALHDFTLDRSPGAGRGWLFKFDARGRLLGKVELTDGAVYHPGGIDFDGTHIWVPVAEYRPNGTSHIYRVDPATLAAERLFTATDHIGAIVRDADDGTVRGVSWGSRRFYTWTLKGGPERMRVVSATWRPNPQSLIDYQDCHYQAVAFMVCGGVAVVPTPVGAVAIGGLDLVDLRRERIEHQVPVALHVDEGGGPNPRLALTHNAFWIEPEGERSLRGYFMTESDGQADLLVYDVTPWVPR